MFWKLGRGNDLQKLLGHILNSQVSMVILMGASGVGKTSLLRAGLSHMLANKDVQYHYWEAVPTQSDERLLRAIQETWNAKAPPGVDSASQHTVAYVPVTLDDLVDPSAALCGQQHHVIVLDQFEQLRGRNVVFRLLRKVARDARPPHRITWIVAFRREFRADWSDFIIPEQEHGFFPPELSLQLFTAEQAQEVIGQLIQDAQLSIEQEVVNNLIKAATVNGEVSPVDIGIGMMVLAELSERQGGKTVTIREYQFAGGAEGLLTQYISRCLEYFPDAERDTLLKAMLTLRNPETSQRIAEGVSIEQIVKEVGAETKRLKPLLDRLAQRDMRLLECVTAPDDPAARYRLPHERLIPALHRLAGTLLVEADQAKLQFERAFLAWKHNGERAQYLLKSNELRLIERYIEQISWGSDAPEKRTFLHRSKWQRNVTRAIAVTAVCALIGMVVAGFIAWNHFSSYLFRLELAEFGLKFSSKVTSAGLELEVSSNTPTVNFAKAGPLFSKLAALGTLRSADLSYTRVKDLQPLVSLTALEYLSISYTLVSNLAPLKSMQRLQTLEITGAKVTDLSPLLDLPNLRTVAIYDSRLEYSPAGLKLMRERNVSFPP